MNELIEFLKAFHAKNVVPTKEEAEQVATLLRGHASTQPVYQHVYDMGHGEATRTFRTKESELNGQITSLTAERDALQKRYNDLEGKTPDAQKVRQEMQTEIDKLNTSITDLKAAHKNQRIEWYRERELGKLKDELIELGVDPDWAAVMAKDEDVKRRLQVTEAEDGTGLVTVLKAGSDSVALQGDKPLGLLAAELRKNVKPGFLTSKADKGAETREGGTGGGGDKTVYERAREQGKAAHTGKRPEGVKSGAERLGVRSMP